MTACWLVLLLAGSVLLLSGGRPQRRREGRARRRCAAGPHPIPAPFRMELVGAALDAGLPIPRALAAVAEAEGSRRLAEVAARLELGLTWDSSWGPGVADADASGWGNRGNRGRLSGGRLLSSRAPWRRPPSGRGRETSDLEQLGRALGFASRTGAPAARMLRAEALAARRRARREAEKRASSLGVRLVLPLGLCSLPALICLGVLPVVIGLFSSLGP
jgi:hypothetical protein